MRELLPEEISAIVWATYERIGGNNYQPKRKRVESKQCPRGIEPEGELRCIGVNVRGVRVVDAHDAPADEFGHNGGYCARGLSRCRGDQCRRCVGIRSNIANAIRHAKNDGLTDDEIRQATPYKRCSVCADEKPSTEFYVDRQRSDGLRTQCRTCTSAGVMATVLPETWRAANQRRRALKAATTVEHFSMDDVRAVWKRRGIPEDTCWWCCRPFTDEWPMQLDHFWPISKGGAHSPYNLVPADSRCNYRKGAKDPNEFRLQLLHELADALRNRQFPPPRWRR